MKEGDQYIRDLLIQQGYSAPNVLTLTDSMGFNDEVTWARAFPQIVRTMLEPYK